MSPLPCFPPSTHPKSALVNKKDLMTFLNIPGLSPFSFPVSLPRSGFRGSVEGTRPGLDQLTTTTLQHPDAASGLYRRLSAFLQAPFRYFSRLKVCSARTVGLRRQAMLHHRPEILKLCLNPIRLRSISVEELPEPGHPIQFLSGCRKKGLVISSTRT